MTARAKTNRINLRPNHWRQQLTLKLNFQLHHLLKQPLQLATWAFCFWLLGFNIALLMPGLAFAITVLGTYSLVFAWGVSLLPGLMPIFQRFGGWAAAGLLGGMLLFLTFSTPTHAAIFDTAEQYANNIFGSYIDQTFIGLIFGFLRLSVFLIGIGFVVLAIDKARHGDNWQPFAWNSFAVLMVVILIEGMSALFLGGTTG